MRFCTPISVQNGYLKPIAPVTVSDAASDVGDDINFRFRKHHSRRDFFFVSRATHPVVQNIDVNIVGFTSDAVF